VSASAGSEADGKNFTPQVRALACLDGVSQGVYFIMRGSSRRLWHMVSLNCRRSGAGGVDFQSPSPGDHKTIEVARTSGPDFAFPVTPNAEDPSVTLFNTWNTIRSRSMSNASELSGLISPLDGISPQNMSPARGKALVITKQ
jgi:hypothetical protein